MLWNINVTKCLNYRNRLTCMPATQLWSVITICTVYVIHILNTTSIQRVQTTAKTDVSYLILRFPIATFPTAMHACNNDISYIG